MTEGPDVDELIAEKTGKNCVAIVLGKGSSQTTTISNNDEAMVAPFGGEDSPEFYIRAGTIPLFPEALDDLDKQLQSNYVRTALGGFAEAQKVSTHVQLMKQAIVTGNLLEAFKAASEANNAIDGSRESDDTKTLQPLRFDLLTLKYSLGRTLFKLPRDGNVAVALLDKIDELFPGHEEQNKTILESFKTVVGAINRKDYQTGYDSLEGVIELGKQAQTSVQGIGPYYYDEFVFRCNQMKESMAYLTDVARALNSYQSQQKNTPVPNP